MGSKERRAGSAPVYADALTLAAWRLIRVRRVQRVTVLEKRTRQQKILSWALQIAGIRVIQATFFAGQLRTDKGACLCTRAREKAGLIALKAARRIVASETRIKKVNETYGRDTVRLFIAKQLHLHIEYWTQRIMVAQALCKEKQIEIWLKKPDRFDPEFLEQAFPDVRLCFYTNGHFHFARLLKSWVGATIRDIGKTALGILRDRPRRIDQPERGNTSVLLFQENSNIRADRRLRAQPHHWLIESDAARDFAVYLIETRSFKVPVSDADRAQLAREGVTVLPAAVLRRALAAERGHAVINGIRNQRRGMVRAAFAAKSPAAGFFLLRVAFLLKEAEKMAALVLWLNARVFVNREPQFSYSDAIQLIAPDLQVTTVAYQYSHMGASSTLMMATADKFLVFSEKYKALYEAEGIAPQECLGVGYLYNGVARYVREKAREHRGALTHAGAEFVVCYFDESVQHDRWGMVSEAEHRGELHALANAVLADATFGVVVKSQFMRNSPSQLYPEDELIRDAKATGRFLELMEGIHVNEIYPTEAALAADLCISHKFGATAGLEAAIAGVRTVLLDAHGTKTLWDDIYARADIEYNTMDSLLEAIAGWRSGAAENQFLGDWSSVLHFFDPYRDGKTAERFYRLIAEAAGDEVLAQTPVAKKQLAAYEQL